MLEYDPKTTCIAIALAACACSDLLEADFGSAKPQPKEVGTGAGTLRNDEHLTEVEGLATPRSEQTYGQFGEAVAMHGATLVVTAPFEDVYTPAGTKAGAGATYVYDLSELSTQTDAHSQIPPPIELVLPNVDAGDGELPGHVLASGFASQEYWGSLRVALDDDLIVIGNSAEDSISASMPSDNSAAESGAVYVYDRTDLHQAPQYVKAPQPEENAAFGRSLALSDSWLIVGAPGEGASGAVYAYERGGGPFDEPTARLQPDDLHAGDLFGITVAVEGDLLVIGAMGDAGRGTGMNGNPADTSADVKGSGAVYVYRFKNDYWRFDQYIKPMVDKKQGLFGYGLSLSGGRFAVGAHGSSACADGDTVAFHGVVYVVDQIAGRWSEQCLAVNTPSATFFGWSVALSGERLFVTDEWDTSGKPDDPTDHSVPFAGAAHMYERSTSGEWEHRAYVKPTHIETKAVFGTSMAVTPEWMAVGDTNPVTGGAVHLFALPKPRK